MSNQERDQVDYVAAMTHELKTSLTAILASAELIADELHPDEGSVQWKLLQAIIRNAHRLDERITAFAQMPRQSVQDFQFRPESLDIGQTVRDVVARIHPRIQARRQTLELEIPDSLPLIKADRQHLEQVLLLLTANATKFSPEGGKITIASWQKDRGTMVVRISDTCGGIPVEEHELIFKPHYQIGRSDGEGGLGLTIAKFLVELNGGKIWLESKSGYGCSFFFSLPLFRRTD
ncbi:MAG TPA: HAMP domain-containing histidine kinase [Dehalococcoidia bacterium]|nr:HAMP domain-containing histidine kinase [Dehalococcoidia bacterium]